MADQPQPEKRARKPAPAAPATGDAAPRSTAGRESTYRPAAPSPPSADPPRKLPPRVVKRKNVRREAVIERPDAEPGDPPSEFLVPVVLTGVSLLVCLITTIAFRPSGISFGWWIGLRMGIILFSTVVTIGALFVAAALLDLSYGFFSTAVFKAAAICLTQAWIADLTNLIHFPLIPWLINLGATYAMFKYFFDLDDMEAIASMVVVNLVHWLVTALLFTALMVALLGGVDVSVPVPADGDPAGVEFEVQELDGEEFDDGGEMGL